MLAASPKGQAAYLRCGVSQRATGTPKCNSSSLPRVTSPGREEGVPRLGPARDGRTGWGLGTGSAARVGRSGERQELCASMGLSLRLLRGCPETSRQDSRTD